MTGKPVHRGRVAAAVSVAVSGLAAVLAVSAPAAAASTTETTANPSVQQRIDEALRDSDSRGKQVSPNQISWENGRVITTFSSGTAQAAPYGCDYGHFCVYDYGNYGGTQASFYDYGKYYLSNYGLRNDLSSWVNNQSGDASAQGYDYLNSAGDLYQVWGAGSNLSGYVEHASLVDTSADNVTDVVEVCSDVCG